MLVPLVAQLGQVAAVPLSRLKVLRQQEHSFFPMNGAYGHGNDTPALAPAEGTDPLPSPVVLVLHSVE
jgi:hypothetical protein